MAAVVSAAARLYAPPGAPVLRPGQILREGLLGLPGRITDGARGLGRIPHVAEGATGLPGPLLPSGRQSWFGHARPRRWRSGMTGQRRAPVPLPTAAAAD